MNSKRFFFKIVLFLLIIFSKNAYSQFSVGPKVNYHAAFATAGAGLQLGYIFSEKVKVTTEGILYLPVTATIGYSGSTSSVKQSFYELNLNGSYLFKLWKSYLYPIAGVNLSHIKVTSTTGGAYFGSSNTTSETSEVGVNIGAGAQYNYAGKFSPFLEGKFTFSYYHGATIGGGVLWNVGRKKSSL
jgi:outer membrane immunogenic protein